MQSFIWTFKHKKSVLPDRDAAAGRNIASQRITELIQFWRTQPKKTQKNIRNSQPKNNRIL